MWCPYGTTAFQSKCYRAIGWTKSLHECVHECSTTFSAAPPCPQTVEETAFLTTFTAKVAYTSSWLGFYNDGAGHSGCVAEESIAPSAITPWDTPTLYDPDSTMDGNHAPEYSPEWTAIHLPCARYSSGVILASCDLRSTQRAYGCVCSYPANSSSSFAISPSFFAAVPTLEAQSEVVNQLFDAEIRRHVGVLVAIAAAIGVMPALLLLCRQAYMRCRPDVVAASTENSLVSIWPAEAGGSMNQSSEEASSRHRSHRRTTTHRWIGQTVPLQAPG